MSADNILTLEKISSGKKLLRFAWIIEIIAAFIGLIIAWSMGYETYLNYVNETGSFPAVHLFDLILAAGEGDWGVQRLNPVLFGFVL